MNREIKFRGKSVENDKWIYGDLKHNETYSICYDKNDVYFEVDDKTVGQFTGLLDINCKEIYEGDIVSCIFFHYYTGSKVEQQLKGIIEWFQGGFVIKVIENDFENAGRNVRHFFNEKKYATFFVKLTLYEKSRYARQKVLRTF